MNVHRYLNFYLFAGANKNANINEVTIKGISQKPYNNK